MLEHPPQLNITQSELAPRVADYFDTLLAQRDAILERYGLTPETADKFCDINTSDEDRETMLNLYENMVYVLQNKRMPPHIKQEQYSLAQEIMKDDFLGIEAVEKTFNIHLSPDDVPDIPFTFEDLDRAKKLGQFLILRVDKTDDGTPLTMELMEYLFPDNKVNNTQGAIRSIHGHQRNEDFFTKECPPYAWALVSKDIILNSTHKNYLQQTDSLVDYLVNDVFKKTDVPKVFQSAIEEWEQSKKDVQKLLRKGHWEEVSIMLEELALTKLVRHSSVEIIYDLLVYFHATGIRLLDHSLIWSSTRDSYDKLVYVGLFNSQGVQINSTVSGDSASDIGVSFSRSD